MDFIHYGTQYIDDDDISEVIDSLKSGFLTTGPKVIEFEKALSETVGSRFAVAVNSGTAALHIAAMLAELHPEDEVITSPITFAASSNCVLYCGAKPIFADICPDTMLLDIESVKSKITAKTRAIIPVHYGGEMCDMDAFACLAEEYGLVLIQDAAHSLGGLIRGKPQGAYLGMQIWSFHPVKTITTGEGGAVTTNDESVYEKLIRYRTHGITRDNSQFVQHSEDDGAWYYEMLDLGYNYRLTDFQCALGISQLKKLKGFAQRRKEIVARYNTAFDDMDVLVQKTPEWSDPVRHLYTIRLCDKSQRRVVYEQLQKKNIGVNVHYIPVYWLPYYQKIGYERGICPIAEDSYERMITLPLHPSLSNEQVEYVIEAVRDVVS